jgi:hypothetical protein
MRLPEIDWSVLRGSVLLAVVSLAVAVTAISGGHWYNESKRAQLEKEQRRFQTNSRRYLAVDDEERLIATHLPQYRALEQQGVIGEEHRLAWAEALRSVSAKLGLPTMRYEIQPQKEHQYPGAPSLGRLKLYASPMRLSLGLLHEDDLFRFLDALAAEALGRFSVERCALRRSGPLQADPSKANLEAECEVLWLTMHQPKDEKAK